MSGKILSRKFTGDDLHILADGWPVKLEPSDLENCKAVYVTITNGGQYVQNAQVLALRHFGGLVHQDDFEQFRRVRENLPPITKGRQT